jgi:hypothetical protein
MAWKTPDAELKVGYCQPRRTQASAPAVKSPPRRRRQKSLAETKNRAGSQIGRIRMEDGGDDVSGSLFVTGNPCSGGATGGSTTNPS